MGSPGAGVPGCCEKSDMSSGNRTWNPARAAGALNHRAMSVVPGISF